MSSKTHTLQPEKAAVVIIGAGISGMCAAIDLIKRNKCHDFIILEKSPALGGTWHDNTYPGCGCDVESILYSYSFAQNSNWTREFPVQEEVLAYLVRVAKAYNLKKYIRFNSTVKDAIWDENLKEWQLNVIAAGSGEALQLRSDFLISAVGQLSQPKYPEIEGLEAFKGKQMHSARWDSSYDLKNKKIALIGNGCSAVQILPRIAEQASKVTVFQRSPNWITPRGDAPVSSFTRNLYWLLPPVQWYKRKVQMNSNEAGFTSLADSKSQDSIELVEMAMDFMHEQLPDRPDLWEKLTPKFSMGCKRAIVSDDFYPTLTLPHVDLETRPIHSISGSNVNVAAANGKVQNTGTDYDLIICATGFKTLDFMDSIEVYGKNGRSLQQVWKDGARAYLGTCVDDMPNFGMLFGPNTAIGHNSLILMIESQSRYINGLIKPVLEARKQGKRLSLQVKPNVKAAFNEQIQARLQNSSLSDPKCSSWYKNAAGLITNAWPGQVLEYQKLLSVVNFADYEVEGEGKTIVSKTRSLNVGRAKEELQVPALSAWVLGFFSTAAVVGAVIWRKVVLRA